MMHDPNKPLLSVDQAIAQLTDGIDPLPSEKVPLQAALGRTLARSVTAPHDLPPFANSAMDGFAVRAADVQGASANSPVELQIVGEAVAGGDRPPPLGEGEAARITTGSIVPPGADAVVPVEWTSAAGPMAGQSLAASVRIIRSVEDGDYIRPAGLDLLAGTRALAAGRTLRPQDVGLLAAMGESDVAVHRRARVAVLSTGDEVVGVDQPLTAGKVRDSNGHMIAAAVEAIGAKPLPLGIAPDDPERVRHCFDRAVESGADLILSTAGVSMGSRDYVRQVIEAAGQLAFWRVNIRPGKPLVHGRYRSVQFLGLPGNPVSSWITFAVFAHPLIDRLHGCWPRRRLLVQAALRHDVDSDGRESFLRAKVGIQQGAYWVELTGDQSSAVLSSLVHANALLHLPAGVESASTGQSVEVWLMGERKMMYVDGEG
jgi:molybdopterin molybdotransferase